MKSLPNLETYSVLREIRRAVDRNPLDGVEGEFSAELTKRSGRIPHGFYMPLAVLAAGRASRSRRALDTTTGVGALKTAVSPDYVELLRPLTMLARLGATVLDNLEGTLAIPRLTTGSTEYWLNSDGQAPTGSNPTVDQIKLAPHFTGGNVALTRSLIKQSAPDIENLVRNDLFKQSAVAIDRAAVAGTGSSGQPLGILNDTGIPTITCNGTPTWANIIGLETIVSAANVEIETGAYLGSPTVAALLKGASQDRHNLPHLYVGRKRTQRISRRRLEHRAR